MAVSVPNHRPAGTGIRTMVLRVGSPALSLSLSISLSLSLPHTHSLSLPLSHIYIYIYIYIYILLIVTEVRENTMKYKRANLRKYLCEIIIWRIYCYVKRGCSYVHTTKFQSRSIEPGKIVLPSSDDRSCMIPSSTTKPCLPHLKSPGPSAGT